MATKTIRMSLVAAALVWGGMSLGSRPAQAADLFYNFYVRGHAGGPPARLYVAPRPTPPLVGHTYITYQPLMPHEYLYRHHRVYWRWDGYRPGNRTSVWWW